MTYIRKMFSDTRFHVVEGEQSEVITAVCGETMSSTTVSHEVRFNVERGLVCPLCATVIRMKNRGDFNG